MDGELHKAYFGGSREGLRNSRLAFWCPFPSRIVFGALPRVQFSATTQPGLHCFILCASDCNDHQLQSSIIHAIHLITSYEYHRSITLIQQSNPSYFHTFSSPSVEQTGAATFPARGRIWGLAGPWQHGYQHLPTTNHPMRIITLTVYPKKCSAAY